MTDNPPVSRIDTRERGELLTGMKKGSDSCPHNGPLLVPSRDEVVRIYDAMHGCKDEVAVSLVAKCEAVLNADPSWRKPLR